MVTATLLQGTPVVAGVVHAPVCHVRAEIDPARLRAYREQPPVEVEEALDAYDVAVAAVVEGFTARAEAAEGSAAEVLTASASLARDRGMRGTVKKNLTAGQPLLEAIDAAVEHFAGVFSSMGGLMAERVTDLRDIGRRVTAHVVGAPEPGVPVPTTPSVVVAEDLAPADSAGLDPAMVAALVMERGGSTSHTAIIARQLGIPCLVGTPGALDLEEGVLVLVDGTAGTVELDVDADAARRRVEAAATARAEVDAWTGPATTSDGAPVTLLANVADPASAAAAAEGPVDGVGLFRTELAFLASTTEPSVEEQADLYAGVLGPFGTDRHVVTRTLDAGSDKPIAFATMPDEENPALGVRGYRLSFDKPDLLERQLDALKIAGERVGTHPWVMAPMIATADEAADFAAKARARGLKPGVMVEIPSAALLAHQLLEHVDFLSIGTNDLTQYTMAADRMATDLTHLTDPWQPAVLHLVAITAAAGRAVGKSVGVCGEAAADPQLACVLVGMGVTSLSMAAASVRAVGVQLGKVTTVQCEAAAEAALGAGDPQAARAAVREVLEG
ncbi:phosphoenolpyruvate--protein phosphotransferase [Nocardioides nanhaiensis]|uniref:Phosphoenolpyruvate-protein phosphotransferase n=1 Tax=Nocardioides nanhaiensis TaxID=1476871 RepID=A0ABP8WW04_9ACTN